MSVVYLAGPINGTTDEEAHGWRDAFMEKLPDHKFLDPMVRDYRGMEDTHYMDIVHGDIEDIKLCNVFLAYCWQPSWGTAIEIEIAYTMGKHVVLVVPEGTRISPWLRYHSNSIFATLAEAEEYLRTIA